MSYLNSRFGAFVSISEDTEIFKAEEITALRNDCDDSLAMLRVKTTKNSVKENTIVFLVYKDSGEVEIEYRLNGKRVESLTPNFELGMVSLNPDTPIKDDTIKMLCDIDLSIYKDSPMVTATTEEIAVLLKAFVIPRMSFKDGKSHKLDEKTWLNLIVDLIADDKIEQFLKDAKYVPNNKLLLNTYLANKSKSEVKDTIQEESVSVDEAAKDTKKKRRATANTNN